MKLPSVAPLEPPSTIPPTMAYISYHAAQRPADTAIILRSSEITYQTFYHDIGRMVAAMRDLKLTSRHVVGVEAPTSYLHLLIVLACETMAVPTVSYRFGETERIKNELVNFDLVMCMPGHEPPNSRKTHVMDEAWYASVMAGTPELYREEMRIGSDTPVRITKSSGTTGRIKWMIHSGRFYRSMLDSYQYRAGFNRHSCGLLTMGLNLQSFFWFTAACLRAGGKIVVPGSVPVTEALSRYAVSHVLFLPKHLEEVVNNLPSDYANAANLTVLTISGPVSKTVRRRVRQKLADNLIVGYGTSEVGVIGTVGDDGTGTVSPGMRLEVIDDNDQPAFGEPGRFRVKSPASIGTYINQPEASRSMFREGWFYPGDIGIMTDSCTFELLGRTDDMFNVGGIKFLPHDLEEKLAEELPVKDVCLTELANDDGSKQLVVVVVPDRARETSDLEGQITTLVPDLYGKTKTVIVDEIPRTDNGKLRRRELSNTLSQL